MSAVWVVRAFWVGKGVLGGVGGLGWGWGVMRFFVI
jgi:hypothetical protein